MFIGDLPFIRYNYSPDEAAFLELSGNKTITYRTIYERVRKLSSILFRKFKLLKGDRVCVISENSVEYFEILFAVLKLGGILVPINPKEIKNDLILRLKDFTPRIIFYSNVSDETEEILKNIPHAIQLINIRKTDALNSEYENLINKADSDRIEDAVSSLKDPAAILYRNDGNEGYSGSIISHGMILWNSINTIMNYELTKSDCAPILFPMNHIIGFSGFAIPLFHTGGRSIILGYENDEKTIKSGFLNFSTFIYIDSHQFMKISKMISDLDINSIRFFIIYGSFIPEGIYSVFKDKGIPVKKGYFLNEAGPNVFYIKENDCEKNTIGIPAFHMKAMVNDHELSALEGEKGELFLQGHSIFSGYWNNPKATKAAFVNGWLKTGDIVEIINNQFYLVEEKNSLAR